MLKTERMKKVVVAGAKPKLRTVIDTLHDLSALHIEEHSPTRDFGLGSPLPEGEKVAEVLLKARGLEKSLGVEDETTDRMLGSLEEAIEAIDRIDGQVGGIIDQLHDAGERLKTLELELARLRRLSGLGLRLEHLSGYRNLRVFVGSAAQDPRPAMAARTDRFELAVAPEGSGFVMALFVPESHASDAEAVLANIGYQAIEVPQGTGSLDAAIGQRTTEARQAKAAVETAQAELRRFREAHGQTLLAAGETLTVAAERASAPLTFATAANSFVVTGYVPATRVDETERALMAATDHKLYVAWEEPQLASHHGHHDHSVPEGAGQTMALEHAGERPPQDPPIRFAHKSNHVKSFTMLLGLHSLPKYREIDPTILMWLTFPLFFGLMVGDIAFGVLVALIAAYFKRHYVLGIGGPRVSRMLMLSAGWTFILGLFMFGEAFGIHFVDAPGTLSWEHLLHQDWSAYYAHGAGTGEASEVAHAVAGHGGGEAAAMQLLAEEADVHGATPHLAFGPVQLGYFSKLHDVTTLLVISILIALVHLNLAILLGIRNMWVLHGAKHAILGRFSWLILQAGIGMVAYGAYDAWPMLTNIGWGLFGLSVVMLLAGEGAIAILELPKIFSNALSYTRLTAVGLSKAGMILAVNTFAFTVTGDHTATINGIGGIILAIVGYLVILGLGVLAGGLHSMRLQFVEFFGWFYEGGGRAFKAFGDRTSRR